jgi:hypothetical protein
MKAGTSPLFGAIMIAAIVQSSAWSAAALAAPAFDPQRQCLDGGLPYPVGAHLCTSPGIVEICLRSDQTYGVKGIYVYDPRAKDVTHFNEAHWISTTSSRCGPNDKGKVYRSSNPKL